MTVAHLHAAETISWESANAALIASELTRLRLLLQQRGSMLRRQRGETVERDEVAIDAHLATVNDELAARRNALADSGQAAAIDLLTAVFSLSAIERDTVVLALAPELDPAFESLIAWANGDSVRRRPTTHLAVSLFAGDNDPSAHLLLAPGGTLRQFRLLDNDPAELSMPLASRTLRLSDRIVEYILGTNRLDPRIAELAQPLPPSLHADSTAMRQIVNWLTSDPPRFARRAVNLIGDEGSGRSSLARAVSDALGTAIHSLNVRRLSAAPDRDDVVHLLAREAALLQLVFYVDADNAGIDAAQLQELVDGIRAFIFIGSRARRTFARETLSMPISRPATADQELAWRAALGADATLVEDYLPRITQQFDFGPGAIARASDAARRQAGAAGTHVEPATLWRACREQVAWAIEELAQRLVPSATFDDLVLPADALEQLRDVAAQVSHRAAVYDGWGFGARLTRGRGITALFAGPSGTGKTMAAEVLAAELDLDLYRVDLSGVVSKYIGETEKNLRRVFDAAEACGAILFFDEADALFGKRTEIKDSHDRYANVEISYLLQRMEEYRGLAILATNLKSHLDQAFMRRLRFIINFPFPAPEQRQRIWERVFPAAAEIAGLEYGTLARLEIAGGNIRNIAVNAAFYAAADARPVSMQDVMRAAQREYQKLDRIVSAAEFGTWSSGARR